MSLLEQVGLADHARHRPNELSGGQRQRVAVARALVGSPQIVLADEPTANLDSETGEQIIDLMKEMNQRDGTTFIFSTHDAKVMAHADAVVRLADGKIVGRETAGGGDGRLRRTLDVLDAGHPAAASPAATCSGRGSTSSSARSSSAARCWWSSAARCSTASISSMSRSIIGSVAGHIQVYSAAQQGRVRHLADGRRRPGPEPDDGLGADAGPAGIGAQRQGGHPDGHQRRADHQREHRRPHARGAARRSSARRRSTGDTPELEARRDSLKEHVRQIVRVLRADLARMDEINTAEALDPEVRAAIERALVGRVLGRVRPGPVRRARVPGEPARARSVTDADLRRPALRRHGPRRVPEELRPDGDRRRPARASGPPRLPDVQVRPTRSS